MQEIGCAAGCAGGCTAAKAAQLTAQTTGCADSDEWVGDADIAVDGHVGTKSGPIYDDSKCKKLLFPENVETF